MFVHLRLHTEFSVIDGITRIDDATVLATPLNDVRFRIPLAAPPTPSLRLWWRL